jgi:hypothetical protein
MPSRETSNEGGPTPATRPRLQSIAERDRLAGVGILGDPDLPTKIVDRIDGVADVFRSRIGEPIERAVTAIALALLVLIVGTAALIMILIGIFRLFAELFSPYEWIAHAAFGVLLVVVGASVFWRRALKKT